MTKIYFKDGRVMDGKIKSFNKYKMRIKLKNGDKIKILNPYDQILMLLEQTDKKINAEQQPPQIINKPYNENKIQQPKLIIGQIWNFEDGSKWELVDIVMDYATLQNIKTQEQICPEKNVLLEINGWTFNNEFSMHTNKKQNDEYEFVPDLSLKIKNLAELRNLEKQQAKSQLKDLTPNKCPGITLYDNPFLPKS